MPAAFSVLQGCQATLLKMVALQNCHDKGVAAQVKPPSFSGALHRSVTATLLHVALHWATKLCQKREETAVKSLNNLFVQTVVVWVSYVCGLDLLPLKDVNHKNQEGCGCFRDLLGGSGGELDKKSPRIATCFKF